MDPDGWILMDGSGWMDPDGWIRMDGSAWIDLDGYIPTDPHTHTQHTTHSQMDENFAWCPLPVFFGLRKASAWILGARLQPFCQIPRRKCKIARRQCNGIRRNVLFTGENGVGFEGANVREKGAYVKI